MKWNKKQQQALEVLAQAFIGAQKEKYTEEVKNYEADDETPPTLESFILSRTMDDWWDNFSDSVLESLIKAVETQAKDL